VDSLLDLGWNDFFENKFRQRNATALVPARVTQELKDAFRVRSEAGEWLAEISGSLRHAALAREQLPAVGDWVGVSPRPAEGRARIHFVLPRRSKISRKVAGRVTSEQILAANLDTLFVVSSLDRDLNPRRIERYLAMVWDSGARPVVLLNKADLCDNPVPLVLEVESVAIGVLVHTLSAFTGAGFDALAPYLVPGQTVALLGSSGVGKSTIINRILGREVFATASVRAGDDRGRHTTASRQLVLLPGGGMLIDTPGLRELQLWDAGAGFAQTFEDIAALAAQCRFTDCRHLAEPGCAVRRAIDNGSLDPARVENFRKLEKELAFFARKQDAALQSAEEKKWRTIHKEQKQIYRFRDRHGRQ
jgi:ribosome biogenesis GTPase